MDSPTLLIGEETTSLDEFIVSYINLQRALKYFQKISNKNNNDNNKTTAHIILFHGIPELSIRRRKKYPDINLLKKKIQIQNIDNIQTLIPEFKRKILILTSAHSQCRNHLMVMFQIYPFYQLLMLLL